MAKSLIVAFEGLDGVGKTSLAQAVAQALGVGYISTPPTDAQGQRSLFEDEPFSDASLLYYLSWVKRVDQDACRGRYGRLVICDRYLGSTMAYFGAAGNDVERFLRACSIQAPDLTVLVTAAEEVRRARLEKRHLIDSIDATSYDGDFAAKVMASYRTFAPLLEVDSTDMNTRDLSWHVSKQILVLVRSYDEAAMRGGIT